MNRSPVLPKKHKKPFNIKEYFLVTSIIAMFYFPFSTMQLLLGSTLTLNQYLAWLWQDVVLNFLLNYPLFLILTKVEPKIKKLLNIT